MKLNQRIKKLEEILIPKQSGEFCDCYQKHIQSFIEAVYYSEKDIEIYPMPVMEKETCNLCNKRISESDKQINNNISTTYD